MSHIKYVATEIPSFSEIFKDDVPDGTMFIVDYPTSQKHYHTNQNVLVNRSMYLIDDGLKKINHKSYFIENPHGILPVLGARLRTCMVEPPSPALLRHWQHRLGVTDIPSRLGNLGDPVPHVCLFPLEQLPAELHAVDPDVHYLVHSKAFIPQINCPQPAVLSELKFPSVLKVCRGSGGHGTFPLANREEYDYWMKTIDETMPWAETILTELVPDVKHDLGCQMYLNRKGEVTWLAAVEKIFNDSGIWIGAGLRTSRQDEFRRLVRPAIEPVVAALHGRGFFGLLGVDVMLDAQDRPYVIDINPRKLGASSMTFSRMALQKLGRRWEAAVYLKEVVVKSASSAEEIVDQAEALCQPETREVIVYSVYETSVGDVGCTVGVFAHSMAECHNTIALLKSQ